MALNKQELKQWEKERDSALESCDIEQFIKFIDKWARKGLYDAFFVEQFMAEPQKYQEGTMAKMIFQVSNMSNHAREWALKVLKELGWDKDPIFRILRGRC